MRFAAALSMLFAATIVAAAPARATEWTSAGETASGNPVYVDIAGMRSAGQMHTAWIRVVYKAPIQAGNSRVASMQALAHFDCASGENAGIRVLMYEDEAGENLAISREEREVRFGMEPDGSVGRIAHALICPTPTKTDAPKPAQ